MLVIHAIWANGTLRAWAEDPALPELAPGGRTVRTVRDHPFACGQDELADLLAELPEPLPDLVRKAAHDELELRLPTIRGGPQASPELVRPSLATALGDPALGDPAPADGALAGAARRGRPSLAAWRVPALSFEPAAALDLLAVLGQRGEPHPDLVTGGSVRFLASVAAFAAQLAARGRVLPVLAAENGGYAARWHPVLDGADDRHAQELAAAMPALCRAGPAEAAGQILSAALTAFADAAARTRLQAPLLPARRGRQPARLDYAERWLAALSSPDPSLDAVSDQDAEEAAALAAQTSAWLAGARLPDGKARTCFRLAEPEADDGAWQVEFTMQSTDDPSLMLSAAEVWAGADEWLGGDAIEQLLGGLGAAARLFPALDETLREPAPAQVTLDTQGAFGFLEQTAPLLAAAGFGVLLPDWARKARLGLKLTTRSSRSAASAVTKSSFGMADLVEFRYDLAIGDQTLDAAELAELAAKKVPLVRLRGQWVELDADHLAAALRFLERNKPGTMTAGEALLAGMHGPGDDVPLTGVDADGWLGDLLSGRAERQLAPVAAPAAFAGTLRPYQERGLAWLSFLGDLGLGAILADDMGLGKTIQLLSLICTDRPGLRAGARPDAVDARPDGVDGPLTPSSGVNGPSTPVTSAVSAGAAALGDSVRGPDALSGQLAGPTLLVCPMSLVGNWQREAARFTPDLRVHVHHGADRLDGAELAAALAGADLVLTTYGVVTRDREALSEVRWRRVVCDEAQTIKNHATKQAQAVRALPAGTKIALTGTPVENRLSELWSIMEFANPGMLGSAERFRQAYAVPVERDGDTEAAARLRRITQPFMLRRLKTDKSIISDLPDKQEMKVWCNLTAEQASLYAATVTDMLAQIEDASDDITRRGLVLATMAKLKQVCNHPAQLLGDGSRLPGRSGKLARLEEICDEIVAEGDKALCFTQYAQFGRMLQPYLAARLGCPVFFLHGGTSRKLREVMLAEFTELGEPALFMLSLKAGGTGLNLTAASHVIHVDRWWNPAVEEQATDRAFRIGQRANVQVRKFVCVGTVEERIDAMIEEKRGLAERIVGTGEGWLTELSTSELRELLTLSDEAVSR